MQMKTNIQLLADRIANSLRGGERRFILEGAELDWVRDAIDDAVKYRSDRYANPHR
jgi:hypothetical protein